ncbi:hypothetical protein BJ508DRAFT_413498 [Ascobolus immersus RN42]|uniref:CWH43-like N-terminal domain-containing protein n=1 Tax=Ascobolus immersus RN42 TaxID=1160509 RepID=A0A3N4IB41_ASCIM|nr:hypothetical protein BJ508DRAFT_413498 [Ascobolus immersus RN42]
MPLVRRLPLWIFPLISGIVWFCVLWAMMIVWLAQGKPRYPSMEPQAYIAYISDVGAYKLKPLFVTGCSITGVFLFLSLLSVRVNHKLTSRTERWFDVLSILAVLMGSVGLILLSVFDTRRHPSLHRLFLFLFMLGLILSAVFTTIEFRKIGKTFAEQKVIRWSYLGKRYLLALEFFLSIAFGVCLYKKKQNVGAVIEWVIAFIFTFYVLSFFIDLRPSVGTRVLPASERREHDQELQRRRTEEEMAYRNDYDSGMA